MGTLTISLTSTPVTGTKSYTVSDADVTALINYIQTQYGAATASAALLLWVQQWVNETANRVQTNNTTLSIPAPITFT